VWAATKHTSCVAIHGTLFSSSVVLDVGARPIVAANSRWHAKKDAVGSVDMTSRFRTGAKICSGVIMGLLVVAALGPAKWAPRTELGWQFDHFIGYLGITLFVCIAWPRPLLVGTIIMAIAALLEGLQALTPDRSANLEAALCGAGGALTAALVAGLFIRVWRLRGRWNAASDAAGLVNSYPDGAAR
jgi:VanZ family protein